MKHLQQIVCWSAAILMQYSWRSFSQLLEGIRVLMCSLILNTIQHIVHHEAVNGLVSEKLSRLLRYHERSFCLDYHQTSD